MNNRDALCIDVWRRRATGFYTTHLGRSRRPVVPIISDQGKMRSEGETGTAAFVEGRAPAMPGTSIDTVVAPGAPPSSASL